MKKYALILLLLSLSAPLTAQYSLQSPDGTVQMKVSVDDQVMWSFSMDGNALLAYSPIGLVVNGKPLVPSEKKVRHSKRTINQTVHPVVPRKQADLSDTFNELTLTFDKEFSIIFRAYDYGVAYRIRLNRKDSVNITGELAEFNFPENSIVYFPEEESFISHNERIYQDTVLTAIQTDQFCSLPVLIKSGAFHMVYSDADLVDYPNMFLEGTGTNQLKAIFPKAVLAVDSISDRKEHITREAEYIAHTSGNRLLPWRAFAIGRNAGDLLEHDLVFVLSRENKIEDTSWIKPGRVAWDWYNALNVYGVDFASGLNTATYKYYIDFASRFGLEYIVLDEGWSKSTTYLTEANPDINLKELIAYGNSKNVGVILWTLWKPLVQNLEETLDLYQKWGVKGVKMDFMQRSDQQMVRILEHVTEECAKHRLLVDYHGTYKPAGLQRTYPNYISNEGVKGSENNKWSADITPHHNVTIPYIRMVAGPMDYTPGVMRNAQAINHTISFARPVSLGTRAHQVAMYVVYESPLQMFADSPSNYLADTVCTSFMARIPVTWDETRAIAGEVGKYVVIARRKGDIWFIAGMTNWDHRRIEVPLDMLSTGDYTARIFSDGINAAKFAEDYRITEQTVNKTGTLSIEMAPGGGYISILRKKSK